jgi:hypothetical protein
MLDWATARKRQFTFAKSIPKGQHLQKNLNSNKFLLLIKQAAMNSASGACFCFLQFANCKCEMQRGKRPTPVRSALISPGRGAV